MTDELPDALITWRLAVLRLRNSGVLMHCCEDVNREHCTREFLAAFDQANLTVKITAAARIVAWRIRRLAGGPS